MTELIRIPSKHAADRHVVKSNFSSPRFDRTRAWMIAFLLSSFFICVSYAAFFLPFAVYSMAQICTVMGKRAGALSSLLVFVVLAVFAQLLGSPTLRLAALLVCLTAPFFLVAISMRERLWPRTAALSVLMLPLCVGILAVLSLPLIEVVKFDELMTSLEHSPDEKGHELFLLLQSVGPVLNDIKQFLSYNVWQRLSWFIWGAGSVSFFFALVSVFASLVFLDAAFEQVQKVLAVRQYVLADPSRFPPEFVALMTRVPWLRDRLHRSTIHIVRHEAARFPRPHVRVVRISLLKKPTHLGEFYFKGMRFIYEGQFSAWRLQQFSMPVPLSLVSIGFLAGVMFWFGGPAPFMTALGSNSHPAVLSLCCLLSFALLSILTLQGLWTFFTRVSIFLGLLCIGILFIAGAQLSLGYDVFLAVFGSIGLLDSVYNLRRIPVR